MDNSVTAYKYKPLESPSHIRIIALAPGEDELKCDIFTVNLDEEPHYEALSYVWGDATKSYNLMIGTGECLQITKSLNNAFRSLRSLGDQISPRHIWADATCIDQTDIKERNHQVQMMATIYRKASRVITYIGEAPPNVELGIRLAKQLRQFGEARLEGSISSDLSNYPELPPEGDPGWEALRTLIAARWSRRTWILQESVLNRNNSMVCGSLTIEPWELLTDVAALTNTNLIPNKVGIDRPPAGMEDDNERGFLDSLHVVGNFHLRHLSTKYPSPDLLYLLRVGRNTRCADRKDKVYGLLGMAADGDELGVIVDYSKSVEEIYIDIAYRILKHGSSLDLFTAVKADKKLQLPSWVPDWSATGSMWREIGRDLQFNASGGLTSQPCFNEELTQVSLKGTVIDEISFVTSDMPTSEKLVQWPLRQRYPIMWEFVTKSLDRVKSLPQYSDTREALWRTLILNASDIKLEADTSFKAAFDAFLDVRTNPVASKEAKALGDNYVRALLDNSRHRLLYTTRSGYLGMTPENSLVGDLIAICWGSHVPYVLRPVGDNFIFIGECYVHGLMKGEAFDAGELKESFCERVFTIV